MVYHVYLLSSTFFYSKTPYCSQKTSRSERPTGWNWVYVTNSHHLRGDGPIVSGCLPEMLRHKKNATSKECPQTTCCVGVIGKPTHHTCSTIGLGHTRSAHVPINTNPCSLDWSCHGSGIDPHRWSLNVSLAPSSARFGGKKAVTRKTWDFVVFSPSSIDRPRSHTIINIDRRKKMHAALLTAEDCRCWLYRGKIFEVPGSNNAYSFSSVRVVCQMAVRREFISGLLF